MADDDTFVLAGKDVLRLDKLLEWHENVGRFIPRPLYRRSQLPNGPMDRRYTGQLDEALASTDASIDVNDVEAIVGPTLLSSSSDTQEVFNPDGWEGSSGDGCRFEFNRSSSQFEFYAIHNTDLDKRYLGLLTGAMSTGTASISVDGISTITGPDLFTSSSDTQTVYNTHGWEGDNNAKFRFEWNQATDHFEFYAGDCPST